MRAIDDFAFRLRKEHDETAVDQLKTVKEVAEVRKVGIGFVTAVNAATAVEAAKTSMAEI